MTATTSLNTHIEKYVGEYANTDDFAFQEMLRQTDLAIRCLANKFSNSTKVEAFGDKGWGQVIGAAYLLEKNPRHLKISEAFEKFLRGQLSQAIVKGGNEVNPFFEFNVRGYTRPIMMHPTHPTHPGKYFDWQTVEIEKPIIELNRFIKEADLKFSLDDGKLFLNINSKDESTIFDKLWATNFTTLLEEKGYTGLERNNEHPHITLINSEVIAKIRDGFNTKHGKPQGQELCNFFFEKILHTINKEIKKQEIPVKFTELSSTYSEDNPPFEEVVVAKLESSYTEKALQLFVQEVEQELQIKIPVKPKSSFHLTVATKYRQPNPSMPEQLGDVINGSGEYAESLNKYWQRF